MSGTNHHFLSSYVIKQEKKRKWDALKSVTILEVWKMFTSSRFRHLLNIACATSLSPFLPPFLPQFRPSFSAHSLLWDRISHSSLRWPGTHYVAQVGHQFSAFLLSQPHEEWHQRQELSSCCLLFLSLRCLSFSTAHCIGILFSLMFDGVLAKVFLEFYQSDNRVGCRSFVIF